MSIVGYGLMIWVGGISGWMLVWVMGVMSGGCMVEGVLGVERVLVNGRCVIVILGI